MATSAETIAGFGKGFLTDHWYVAGVSKALKPGELGRCEIMGQPIMLGRGPDAVPIALGDICPHRAAPLSAGRFVLGEDGHATVECPYHGWRFGADGRCAAIPSLTDDQTMDIRRIGVRRYPVRESQGLIFVWMAAEGRETAPPEAPPPIFPGVVGGAPKLVLTDTFASHIDHAVVGLMDPAHGSFVHQQWWWRSQASIHAKSKAFAPADLGFSMVRHAPSSNSRAYRLLGGQPETEITFRLPGLRWEHVTIGNRQLLSLTCLTPLTDNATRITQILWSDHPAVSLLLPFVRIGARRFLRQDGAMVDLQSAGLRHKPSLIWIDDADTQARWYAALKREWAASRREGRDFENPVQATTLRWRS